MDETITLRRATYDNLMDAADRSQTLAAQVRSADDAAKRKKWPRKNGESDDEYTVRLFNLRRDFMQVIRVDLIAK